MGSDPTTDLGAQDIAALFTRDEGYLCARWGRPVAPVIFGLADDSLAVFRAAIAAVLADLRHPLAETDPDMGANMMFFFLRDWSEMDQIPDLAHLTGQAGLGPRLAKGKADQYRIFRFDPDGSIRACLCFVNMGGALKAAHPGALAEMLAVRAMLTFAGDVQPSRRLAAVMRAAYDPVMPACATDASHALRLLARLN